MLECFGVMLSTREVNHVMCLYLVLAGSILITL